MKNEDIQITQLPNKQMPNNQLPNKQMPNNQLPNKQLPNKQMPNKSSTAEALHTTRVIVGLGNPEDTYKGTRHNIGFETINKLSYDHHITVKKLRHRAYMGEGVIAGVPVLLVKPQTYMNLSGESVRAVLQYYKLPPSALIVLYDDTNLPVGDVRVREKGSAGGHNGMKSIIRELQTDQFIRIRIGIGEKPPGWDLADYVLSRFKKEEWLDMIDGVTKAGDATALILTEGTARAMDTYNKRVKKSAEQETNP